MGRSLAHNNGYLCHVSMKHFHISILMMCFEIQNGRQTADRKKWLQPKQMVTTEKMVTTEINGNNLIWIPEVKTTK